MSVGAEVLAHDVAAERKRQAGLAEPPFAEVDDEVQAVVAERELAFVDQQPDIHLAVDDRVFDLIERRDDGLEVRLVEAEREIRARERPGDGDALARARRSRVIGVRATRRGP